MSALVGFVPLLAACAFALWVRAHRRSEREYLLVEVGGPRGWSGRPRLVRLPEERELMLGVISAIEAGGLGHPKAFLFCGKPTMDLAIETNDPQNHAGQLTALLAGYPAVVSVVGRHGDLAWVTKLWRHT
jgi:hypothetical protein